MTVNFIGEKEKEQINGLICKMWLLLLHKQLITITKKLLRNLWQKKCPYVFYRSDRRKHWKFEKKEGKMKISILVLINTIHFAHMKVYTKFENTGSNRRRGICDRNFHWSEKNDQMKGLISSMWLFSGYTIQLITIKLCTKFQSPNSSSCWEIFDRKMSLCIIKEWAEKSVTEIFIG